MIVETGDDGKTRIRGNPDHPFTRGFICAKGAGHLKRLRSQERITEPLLKKGGKYHPITWDEALDLCAERINSLVEAPESILHVHGHGYRGVLAQASSIFFAGLGSSTTYGSLCDEAGIQACIRDFGSLNHNDPSDLLNASRIVNWGRDLSRSSIHTGALASEARKKGVRILTISPGGDRNHSYSDEFIRIKPGTDRFLAAAVMRILLEQGGVKPEITYLTSNWDRFRDVLFSRTVGQYMESCGMNIKSAERIASWYAESGPTASLIGWGMQRHVYGGENVRFINALALLSGNIGRSGGGSYYNLSSSRNFVPWPVPDKGPRRQLLLPDLGREILDADPEVRMIWVDGINIVNQAPGCRATAKAFEEAEYVVAVDAFMNDTVMCADLVLPCALVLEREEIVGSFFHNYVNYSAKVFDPPGAAKSDLEIMTLLNKRLDNPVDMPDSDALFAKAFESPTLEITLEEMKKTGFTKSNHADVAYSNMKFHHRDGKYCFPEALHDEPASDPDYPLQLLTLVNGKYLHSQILEELQTGLPEVRVSPQNSIWEKIEAGGEARLASPHGWIRVRVEKEEGLHPEAVIIRRGGWMKKGWSANPIIGPHVTDMGNVAAYYSQKVKLEVD